MQLNTLAKPLKSFLNKRGDKNYCKMSYSQSGEDIIISFIFNALGIKKPSYWDIGAYHPYDLSNTAKFYNEGNSGILIEPNPDLTGILKKRRGNDLILNVGFSDKMGKLQYYRTNSPTLNTFSFEDINGIKEDGVKIISVDEIDVITPQYCSEVYFNSKYPDFVSLDVEGGDLEILKAFNLKNISIPVFCVETITYSTTGHGVKRKEIIDYMLSCGYMIYADTYINTIFVLENIWKV